MCAQNSSNKSSNCTLQGFSDAFYAFNHDVLPEAINKTFVIHRPNEWMNDESVSSKTAAKRLQNFIHCEEMALLSRAGTLIESGGRQNYPSFIQHKEKSFPFDCTKVFNQIQITTWWTSLRRAGNSICDWIQHVFAAVWVRQGSRFESPERIYAIERKLSNW